jgi:hypothetical protein
MALWVAKTLAFNIARMPTRIYTSKQNYLLIVQSTVGHTGTRETIL